MMAMDSFSSPSTVEVVEPATLLRRRHGERSNAPPRQALFASRGADGADESAAAVRVFVMTFDSAATLSFEHDQQALDAAIARAFAGFEHVFAKENAETNFLDIFVVAADFSDDVYARVAAAEDRLAAEFPDTSVDVHVRVSDPSARPRVPAGSREVVRSR